MANLKVGGNFENFAQEQINSRSVNGGSFSGNGASSAKITKAGETALNNVAVILAAGTPMQLAQTPQTGTIGQFAARNVLNAKASFQSLTAPQQARVKQDLENFSATSSYLKSVAGGNGNKLLSHIGDALIYCEQLRNTPSSDHFAAKSATSLLDRTMAKIVSGQVPVQLAQMPAGVQAFASNGTVNLNQSATPAVHLGSSLPNNAPASPNFASDLVHETNHVINNNKTGNPQDVFLDEYSAQITGYKALGRPFDKNLQNEILQKIVTQANTPNHPYRNIFNFYNSNSAFKNVIDGALKGNRLFSTEDMRNALRNAGFNSSYLNKPTNPNN